MSKMPEAMKPEAAARRETAGEMPGQEGEITPEAIEVLPDYVEPAAFYRGCKAEDAFRAVFGALRLEANPSGEVVGSRDNATVNLDEAIPVAPTSVTRDGGKFLCAIGFDPLPGARIEPSFLGRFTSRRVSGPVRASEMVLRFADKKPGRPQPEIRYFAPREFFEWYRDNVARL